MKLLPLLLLACGCQDPYLSTDFPDEHAPPVYEDGVSDTRGSGLILSSRPVTFTVSKMSRALSVTGCAAKPLAVEAGGVGKESGPEFVMIRGGRTAGVGRFLFTGFPPSPSCFSVGNSQPFGSRLTPRRGGPRD